MVQTSVIKNITSMKNMNEGCVSFSLKEFISQANNEIDYLKRWKKKIQPLEGLKLKILELKLK